MAQLVRGKRAIVRWWRARRAAPHASSGNENGGARAAAPAAESDPRHAIVP
jgi:hypothetical protein